MVPPAENEMPGFVLTFENSSHINTEDAELKSLQNLLEKATSENDQKKYFKQIVDVYKSSIEQEVENQEAKNILLEFFTKYSSKKVLKKFLQAVIGPNLSCSLVQSTTDEILENINNNRHCNIKQCYNLVNFVYISQTSAEFPYRETIESLFPLYFVLFEGFVYNMGVDFENSFPVSEELNTLMNAVLKQILFGLAKIVPYTRTISILYSMKLIVLCHGILTSENIGFDLKTKSGLIIMYSCNTIPEIYRHNFKYKECPPLELIEGYNDERCFTLVNYKLPTLKHVDSIVTIYTTIFTVLPQNKLLEIKINDQPLICILFSGLLDCAQGKPSVSNVIIEISRSISMIGKHLTLIPLEKMKTLYPKSIFYAWGHVDHFLDSVRNYARQFFADLAMLAAHHRSNGNLELMAVFLRYVKELALTQNIRFLGIENIAQYLGLDILLQNFPDLQDSLLIATLETVAADQACKTYISIMEKHFQKVDRDMWVQLWIIPVTRVLKNSSKSLIPCQKIVIRAFQLHPLILRTMYPVDYIGNTQESCVLLKCLHYARLNGLKLTVDKKDNNVCYWRGLIDRDKLMKFAVHQDDEVRISVLAAIVDSQKTTEIFLDWELEFLLMYLHYNITSQIPNIRKQMITYYKKAFTRYSAGYYVIVKHISGLSQKIEKQEDKREPLRFLRIYQEMSVSYKTFIRKITKQLISYLTYDSNYFRRSTTLDLLISVQKFLHTDQWQFCWTEDDVKNCHNILFDSYESNKKMALMLLKHLPPRAIGFTTPEFTFKYMQRCLDMVVDLKPSKTLSAAYLLEACTYSPYYYDVVQQSEIEGYHRTVNDPKLDLIIILVGKLMGTDMTSEIDGDLKSGYHGILFSMRHIIENRDMSKDNEGYAKAFEHIVIVCLNSRAGIMPIICSEAPEGYLPDADEDVVDRDATLRAQKLVCFAWRTIKEMTLLFAEIVRQTIKLQGSVELISEKQLIQIGRFFFEIFVETKHRGVFEKAFVGFSVICESFWMCKNSNISCLPRAWLRNALDFCTGDQETNTLTSTRRSAGLPFLILAILSSEPAANNRASFHRSMRTLLATCENVDPDHDKFRIHCMNVLRMIFRHSRLGEAVAFYVASGIMVVSTCFKSSSWDVRNSATLLFSSLITRIFGVQRTADSVDLCLKNRLTLRVFFLRYPELFEFILKTLSEECTNRDSLVIHPLLMILARLYPAHIEEHNAQVEQFLPYITRCLTNPYYRTRDLAARASVPLVRADKVRAYLLNCFEKLLRCEIINDNECQGVLLQIWHILTSHSYFTLPLTQCFNESIHILRHVGTKFSHMTASLYMEVILETLTKFPTFIDIEMLKQIMICLSQLMTSNLVPTTSMGKFSQVRMRLFLFITLNKFEECEVTYPTITNQIMSHLYGHNTEMKRFCLNLLIYMNQVLNDTSSKHALFQLEELQIPKEISTLVDTFDKNSIIKTLTHIHPYLKCFLTEEIKFQHYIKKEDQVLLFLLLNYYPCVIRYLNLSKQETLNILIKFCSCDNEELISAVVSCISTFLLQLDYNVLSYSLLVQILIESASPAASAYRRLAVCDFLSRNYILYCNEDPILSGDELQMILNIIMVLLEDDELIVRNAMSTFASMLKIRIILNKNTRQKFSGYRWPVVPEKAREDLLNLAYLTLPKDRAICFLFSWACRHFPDSSCNEASEVFERSEVNLYAENVPFMDSCVCLLHKLLWPLEDDLKYEDRSIFMEEHTLLVTTNLLDSLSKHPSPMMLYKTKLSVICALKSIIKFLERYVISDNFLNEFRVYLDKTTLGYLTKQVDHSDSFTVKRIIKRIYDPIFNYKTN